MIQHLTIEERGKKEVLIIKQTIYKALGKKNVFKFRKKHFLENR